MKTRICLLLIGLLLAFCSQTVKDKTDQRVGMSNFTQVHEDGYVGDKQCISCHSQAFEDWKGSDHDLAMQVANDSTVLGDFNDVHTTLDGVSYYFSKDAGAFKVDIKEIDGTEKHYIIGYTFGVFPLQQYLVDFDKGRKQVLRVSWDVRKQKWYHQYGGDKIDPHDWLHWTESAQNWNSMCAECHSTNLKKNYSIEADSFHTTWSSINVSCESCHGPAEKHVYWANHRDTSDWKNSYILSAHTQFEQMNTCAPCHSRRTKLTENMVPGERYDNQYLLQDLSDEHYHRDGQIKDEDYVYASFLQSKMYHNDVKCSDCHNMHSTKLKLEGNKLCLQCHDPAYDKPSHHFHKMGTESSQCVNCHMPGATYMGIDFRRDHSFRIPRPDQSVEYGTPNACTQCHDTKSDKWAADQIVKWYGTECEDHFSNSLLVSNKNQVSATEKKELFAFISNLEYPAIARATVLENLEITSNKDFQPVIDVLKDSSPLIRFNALQKFQGLNPADRVAIASEYLDDTSRVVRIGAAQLLVDVPDADLQNLNQSSLHQAREDLQTMLFTNADLSIGRMRLADYYMQKGETQNAIENYQVALKKDSLLLPVYPNLAIAYSSAHQTQNAMDALNHLLGKAPDYARGYYLRGILNFELNENSAAVSDLKKAISLDPSDTRAGYNLATFYYQNKKWSEAEKVINSALKVAPGNGDYLYLLALIYQGQGKSDAYAKLMIKLQQMQQQQRMNSN